jgi:hypothetical protein
MNTNKDPRLAAIDRKIMMIGIYDIPGIFAIAGGLLGKFGEPDEIPFEFLTNTTITTALLIFGGVSVVWFGYGILSLTKEKMRIQGGRKD